METIVKEHEPILKEHQSIVKERKLKTASFKEVHASLNQECEFLQRVNHDQQSSFSEKGTFLSNIGFKNSIATKMYQAVVKNSWKIKDYQQAYHGQYKFILEPQLERVCERYNLFVRPLEFFSGDIPEMNIKHMQNFKLKWEHLPELYRRRLEKLLKWSVLPESVWEDEVWGEKDENGRRPHRYNSYRSNLDEREQYNNRPDSAQRLVKSMGFTNEIISQMEIGTGYWSSVSTDYKIPLEQLVKIDNVMMKLLASETDMAKYQKTDEEGNIVNLPNPFYPRLVIAAIEELFLPDAFNKSIKRIDKGLYAEPMAKAQVDTDPIVMYETADGYLIITAWGDEANDELVANENLN